MLFRGRGCSCVAYHAPEVHAENEVERLLNAVILCLSLIIFSSFISSNTAAVTRLRSLRSGY